MGPDAALYPEHMVILDTDPDAARQLARKNMALYLGLPNYTNNLLRHGFEQSDIDGGPGGGPSNRLVDAIVAWGTPEQITTRVREHLDAGADHVGVQVLAGRPRSHSRRLADPGPRTAGLTHQGRRPAVSGGHLGRGAGRGPVRPPDRASRRIEFVPPTRRSRGRR